MNLLHTGATGKSRGVTPKGYPLIGPPGSLYAFGSENNRNKTPPTRDVQVTHRPARTGYKSPHAGPWITTPVHRSLTDREHLT